MTQHTANGEAVASRRGSTEFLPFFILTTISALFSAIVLAAELTLVRSDSAWKVAAGFVIIAYHGAVTISLVYLICVGMYDTVRAIFGRAAEFFTPRVINQRPELRWTFAKVMTAIFACASPLFPVAAYLVDEGMSRHAAMQEGEMLARARVSDQVKKRKKDQHKDKVRFDVPFEDAVLTVVSHAQFKPSFA
jgi:hypothetical protein